MPLLSLPPEVRIMIWGFLVKKPGYIRLQHRPSKPVEPSKTRSGTRYLASDSTIFLAIALTCRELYLEASQVYYGLNSFRHPHGCEEKSIPNFFQAIGPHNTAFITTISIELSMSLKPLELETLPATLKTLEIVIDHTASHVRLSALEGCVRRNQVKLKVTWNQCCINKTHPECHDFNEMFAGIIAAIIKEEWAKGKKRAEMDGNYWNLKSCQYLSFSDLSIFAEGTLVHR